MAYPTEAPNYGGENFQDLFTNSSWNSCNFPFDTPLGFLDDQFENPSNVFLSSTTPSIPDPQFLGQQSVQTCDDGSFLTSSPTTLHQQNAATKYPTFDSVAQNCLPSSKIPEPLKSKDYFKGFDGNTEEKSPQDISMVDAPVVKRKRGPNKNKKTRTKEQEDKKREDFLNRNKVAAAKCRHRKKVQHDTLVARALEYENEKPQLVAKRLEYEDLLTHFIREIRSDLHNCKDAEHKTAMTMRVDAAEAVLHNQQLFNEQVDNITSLSMLINGRSQSMQSNTSRLSEVSEMSGESANSKLHDSGISGMSESPQPASEAANVSPSLLSFPQMMQTQGLKAYNEKAFVSLDSFSHPLILHNQRLKPVHGLEGMTKINDFLTQQSSSQ